MYNCLYMHDSATAMFVKTKVASTNPIHKQNYTVRRTVTDKVAVDLLTVGLAQAHPNYIT